MFWVIRWTDRQTGADQSIVVEAKSRTVAETIALKRDIPVVFIGEADDADVAQARDARLLWQYSHENRRTCFGQPIASRQLACLRLCGLWTIGVLLQSAGILTIGLRLPL